MGHSYAMMNWIKRITLAGLLLYVVVAAAAFFGQRKALYFPPNMYHTPPADMTEIRTRAGHLGWHSPAKPGRPTVMVFHGNASSIDSNLHIFRDLQAQGYGVWSAGYPGYPGTEGRPTQSNLVAAAIDQYEHLSNIGTDNIVFYGTSLGSGVAAQLAAKHPPQLLILDAPFNSVLDMAQTQVPFLPTRILLKDRWQSDEALENLETPLMWIHGTADNIIPLSQGQKLYEAYKGPKSAHIFTGASHINTWVNGGREDVLTALAKL